MSDLDDELQGLLDMLPVSFAPLNDGLPGCLPTKGLLFIAEETFDCTEIGIFINDELRGVMNLTEHRHLAKGDTLHLIANRAIVDALYSMIDEGLFQETVTNA